MQTGAIGLKSEARRKDQGDLREDQRDQRDQREDHLSYLRTGRDLSLHDLEMTITSALMRQFFP